MYSKIFVYLLSYTLLVNEGFTSSQSDSVAKPQNRMTNAERSQVSAFGKQNENSSPQPQNYASNPQRMSNNRLGS